MGVFVETEEFKKLNVGCVIDESMPGETDVFNLGYAERSSWCKYFIFERLIAQINIGPHIELFQKQLYNFK